MVKQKVAIASLLALALTAAGCASKTENETGNNGATGTGTEKVTLTYASWGALDTYQPIWDEIIAKFQETHPNINIKIEQTPNKQYWSKLETAATGETLPDIMWMNGPRIQQFALGGMLLPIDDKVKTDNYDMKNYPQSLVDLYTVNGKLYGIPKDFDTIGVWYNKKLFDDAGVKYPDGSWDWNTFTETAKKLTNPSKGVWGVAAALDSQGGYYNTIFQAGGQIISDDKKTSGYDSPEAISGLKFWTDLINVHKASPTLAQMTDTEPLSLFQSGKVAMLWEGSWNALDFAKHDYLKDKVDVAPLPKGKQQAVVIHGLANVISAKTKHPKEAWEFLKFLGSKEAADIQGKSGIVIPAFNGTQDVWVKALPQIKLQTFIDEVAYSKPYPTSQYTSKWASQEAEIFTKAWSGQITPEEAGKQMAQKMNEALKQEK